MSPDPSAIPLFQKSIAIDERRQDDNDRQVSLSNIGEALGEAGAFRHAIGDVRQALIISRKLRNAFQEGVSLQILGSLLGTVGDYATWEIALNRSVRLLTETGQTQMEGVTTAALSECSIRVGDITNGNVWADRAWELAANYKYERDFIRAAIFQGQAALRQGNDARADERLHHALTRARSSSVVEFELRALISIAELEFQRGRLAEAGAHLEDVWEAAERGRYPLRQADAFNVLAAIAISEGDKPAAIAAAINAYKAAWGDGPPYAYHWALQKAKAHLAALGAPEPAMPAFDESKFPPMPEVEINPKDEYWVDPDKLD